MPHTVGASSFWQCYRCHLHPLLFRMQIMLCHMHSDVDLMAARAFGAIFFLRQSR